jgi:hypothetical protein
MALHPGKRSECRRAWNYSKIARIASVMTTGGKGLWKKSAPSMGEVWSIFDFFWNIAGNLKRFLHKVNILTISK